MYATLSTLIPAAQKERLGNAVRLRASCREYAGSLSPEATARLAYLAGRYALPGAEMTLLSLPDNAFTNITGCRMAAAVLLSGGSWLHQLNAGIIGEAFVLEATAMGLGTCWVGGSYRRSVIAGLIPPEKTLACLIAVGPSAQPLTAPEARCRMAPDSLCRGEWRQWPEPFLHAAALVQQAPSGMNRQPWALLRTPNGSLALDAPLSSALDAGIALLHAELALTQPHAWRFSDAPGAPLAVAEKMA